MLVNKARQGQPEDQTACYKESDRISASHHGFRITTIEVMSDTAIAAAFHTLSIQAVIFSTLSALFGTLAPHFARPRGGNI